MDEDCIEQEYWDKKLGEKEEDEVDHDDDCICEETPCIDHDCPCERCH